MKYLHTMVRITDLDESLKFYCDALGLEELRRHESKEAVSYTHLTLPTIYSV